MHFVSEMKALCQEPLLGFGFTSRSHDAVIRVYDDAGSVIDTHEHKDEFKEW